MRLHLVTAHLWGVFTCRFCNLVFFHPDEISRHLLEAHGDLRTAVSCPSCKAEVSPEGKVDAMAGHYR